MGGLFEDIVHCLRDFRSPERPPGGFDLAPSQTPGSQPRRAPGGLTLGQLPAGAAAGTAGGSGGGAGWAGTGAGAHLHASAELQGLRLRALQASQEVRPASRPARLRGVRPRPCPHPLHPPRGGGLLARRRSARPRQRPGRLPLRPPRARPRLPHRRPPGAKLGHQNPGGGGGGGPTPPPLAPSPPFLSWEAFEGPCSVNAMEGGRGGRRSSRRRLLCAGGRGAGRGAGAHGGPRARCPLDRPWAEMLPLPARRDLSVPESRSPERGQRLRTFLKWATGVPGLGDRGGGEGEGALCGAARGGGGAGGGGAGQNERRSRTHYTPQDRLYKLKKKIHAAEGTTEERAETSSRNCAKALHSPLNTQAPSATASRVHKDRQTTWLAELDDPEALSAKPPRPPQSYGARQMSVL